MKILLTCVIAMTSMSSWAQNLEPKQEFADYYKVQSITIKQEGPFKLEQIAMGREEAIKTALTTKTVLPDRYGHIAKSTKNVGEYLMIAEKVIALGEKIYEIIERGRPVVQTQYEPISVLPKDTARTAVDVMDMELWKGPKAVKYAATYKNVYGMEVVKIEFVVMFSYGGSYEGKGRYITSAQIIPSKVYAAWGFNVDARMKLNSITNKGTASNPVAAAVLNFSYTVKTVFQHDENHMSFYIDGNGGLTTF